MIGGASSLHYWNVGREGIGLLVGLTLGVIGCSDAPTQVLRGAAVDGGTRLNDAESPTARDAGRMVRPDVRAVPDAGREIDAGHPDGSASIDGGSEEDASVESPDGGLGADGGPPQTTCTNTASIATAATNDFSDTCARHGWDPYGAACLGACSPEAASDGDPETRACVCNSGRFDLAPLITETYAATQPYDAATWTYKYAIADNGCVDARIVAACWTGTSYLQMHEGDVPGRHTITVDVPADCLGGDIRVRVQPRLASCPGDCANGDHYVMFYEGGIAFLAEQDVEHGSTFDGFDLCVWTNERTCLGACAPENAVDEDPGTFACLCDSGTFDKSVSIEERFSRPGRFRHATWRYRFEIANRDCVAAEISAQCFNGSGYLPIHTSTVAGIQTVTATIPRACLRPTVETRVTQRLASCPGGCSRQDHFVHYHEGRIEWGCRRPF